MKNKALTYVLLIVVGIIWYQVFFRVKGNLTGEDATIPKPNRALAAVRFISRDTVDLHVDYRDPFHYKKLARVISLENEQEKSNKPPQRPQPRVQKPQFTWPKVTYHGLIRNRSSNHPLALIRVDGLVYNLRNGEEIYNSIYVKSITPDSVIIGYKKHRKTIRRN